MIKKIVILLIILISYSCSDNFEYKVADHFYNRTEDDNFLFMFVEVPDLDAGKIIETSVHLKKKYLMDSIDPGQSGVTLIHYYEVEDTIAVPLNMYKKLQQKYKKQDIAEKLNYVPKGVIFLGYTGREMNFKDTLFVSELFVPKRGFKAQELLLNNVQEKKETLND